MIGPANRSGRKNKSERTIHINVLYVKKYMILLLFANTHNWFCLTFKTLINEKTFMQVHFFPDKVENQWKNVKNDIPYALIYLKAGRRSTISPRSSSINRKMLFNCVCK